ADSRQEEAFDLNAPEIESELRRVAALRPGQVVQNLVRIVEAELRQVDGQPEGCARGGGVEAAQPAFGDFDGRDSLGLRALRAGSGPQALVGDANLVQQAVRQKAV